MYPPPGLLRESHPGLGDAIPLGYPVSDFGSPLTKDGLIIVANHAPDISTHRPPTASPTTNHKPLKKHFGRNPWRPEPCPLRLILPNHSY